MKKLFLSLLTIAALFAVALCGCQDNKLYQGEFYTLQQAYDFGWLTQDDLKSIAYYHNGGTQYNEEIMDADFQPQLKSPENLDQKTERSVKRAYIDKYLNGKNAKERDLHIDGYYGSYNGCIPLMLSDNFGGTTGVESRETVGGVTFFYNSGYKIKIWKAVYGGIDKALAKQIKNDYVKNNDDGKHDLDSKDLRLTVYGEYNGTYVMFIDGPWYYMDVITTETVGGVEFIYGSSRTLTAYNSGKFYSLEKAYENQLLTCDNLLDINAKYLAKQFKIY